MARRVVPRAKNAGLPKRSRQQDERQFFKFGTLAWASLFLYSVAELVRLPPRQLGTFALASPDSIDTTHMIAIGLSDIAALCFLLGSILFLRYDRTPSLVTIAAFASSLSLAFFIDKQRYPVAAFFTFVLHIGWNMASLAIFAYCLRRILTGYARKNPPNRRLSALIRWITSTLYCYAGLQLVYIGQRYPIFHSEELNERCQTAAFLSGFTLKLVFLVTLVAFGITNYRARTRNLANKQIRKRTFRARELEAQKKIELFEDLTHDVGERAAQLLRALRQINSSKPESSTDAADYFTPDERRRFLRDLEIVLSMVQGAAEFAVLERHLRKKLPTSSFEANFGSQPSNSLAPSYTSLGPVIQIATIAARFSRRKESRKVIVEQDLEPGIMIRRDSRIQLIRAMRNFMVNAHEAAVIRNRHPKSTPRILVASKLDDDRKHAEIVVADNGPGLRPKVLGRLIGGKPPASTKGSGRGRGIRIARRCIAEIGGSSLICNSPSGSKYNGLRVTLTIPATPKGAN